MYTFGYVLSKQVSFLHAGGKAPNFYNGKVFRIVGTLLEEISPDQNIPARNNP